MRRSLRPRSRHDTLKRAAVVLLTFLQRVTNLAVVTPVVTQARVSGAPDLQRVYANSQDLGCLGGCDQIIGNSLVHAHRFALFSVVSSTDMNKAKSNQYPCKPSRK